MITIILTLVVNIAEHVFQYAHPEQCQKRVENGGECLTPILHLFVRCVASTVRYRLYRRSEAELPAREEEYENA